MKETLERFLKEFSESPTETQVEVMNELKDFWKKQLEVKGENAEKELMYIKDVFKSHYPS